jgi:hypothetical protein
MKRVIPYSLAFIITVAIKGTYTSLLLAVAKLRGDTISLNAHEHNAAAREALSSLHIPNLQITESHFPPSSVVGLSFLLTITEVASTLVIFFLALWFVRLITRSNEGSNPGLQPTAGRSDV